MELSKLKGFGFWGIALFFTSCRQEWTERVCKEVKRKEIDQILSVMWETRLHANIIHIYKRDSCRKPNFRLVLVLFRRDVRWVAVSRVL